MQTLNDGVSLKNLCRGRSSAVLPLAVILFALASGCAPLYRAGRDVSGRYSHPGGGGITLHADGTFTRWDPPSLGTPPTVKGRWRPLDRHGLIVANTYQQPDGYPCRIASSAVHDDLRVQVDNWLDGTTLPGIRVKVTCMEPAAENRCNTMEQEAFTDETGTAHLPHCPCRSRTLYVFWHPGKTISAFWEIKDPAANEIAVRIDPLQPDFITDQVWLVRKGKLYICWDRYPLERKRRPEDD
jgi:hypothetical protein